jgi:hypothetical protein
MLCTQSYLLPNTTSSSRLSALGIPSSFKLLGYTVTVQEIPDLPDVGRYGDFDRDTHTIRLYTDGQSDHHLLHSFFHEATHALLEIAGYMEDSEDERKVDLLAGLIAQAVLTRSR